MGWRIILSKKAQKDGRKLAAANLEKKTQELLGVLSRKIRFRIHRPTKN